MYAELLDINYWNIKNFCLYIIFIYIFYVDVFYYYLYSFNIIITLITKQIKYFTIGIFMVCFTYLFETNILFLQY